MKRVKAAATQTHLTAAERMSNVSSAFEVVQLNLLEGILVLLVDDVNATFAIVFACAIVLH